MSEKPCWMPSDGTQPWKLIDFDGTSSTATFYWAVFKMFKKHECLPIRVRVFEWKKEDPDTSHHGHNIFLEEIKQRLIVLASEPSLELDLKFLLVEHCQGWETSDTLRSCGQHLVMLSSLFSVQSPDNLRTRNVHFCQGHVYRLV